MDVPTAEFGHLQNWHGSQDCGIRRKREFPDALMVAALSVIGSSNIFLHQFLRLDECSCLSLSLWAAESEYLIQLRQTRSSSVMSPTPRSDRRIP